VKLFPTSVPSFQNNTSFSLTEAIKVRVFKMNELILYIAGLLPLDRGRYLGIYDVFLKQINFVDCS
jgi:hypothetical protein